MRRQRRLLRSIITVHIAIILALLLCAPDSSQAFKPNNSNRLAPTDGTHESITEQAIFKILGTTKPTKSMAQAINTIGFGNAWVDASALFFSPKYHFDAESLAAGQQNLTQYFDEILVKLKDNNLELARLDLGTALHGVQDFYSHTNWIELGNAAPNAALGRSSSTLPAPPVGATCVSCTVCTPPSTPCSPNLITGSLTSGYFGLVSASKPTGKCSHGGSWDRTSFAAPTGGINKDTSNCNESPHSHLHGFAATMAMGATEQFLLDLQSRVTFRQFKALLGVGPTLAFAIDTTGSMGSIIQQVKQQATKIVDERLGTLEEPIQYVLVPFNDPGLGPVTVTGDPAVFKNALNALTASGGGDCPEVSNSGIFLALSSMDPGGDLFVFTDASAKDGDLAPNVGSLALSKNIKVHNMLFGSCSPIDPSYIRLARDSGGQVFFLSRSEAGNITRLANLAAQSNAVDVLSIDDTLSGTPRTYEVPLDSTMTRAVFSVSGTASVTLKRPDGTVVQPSAPGVSFIPLSTGAVFSVMNPAPGNWSVTVQGSTNIFSLRVLGESPLFLSSFQFVEPGGRPGHEGFFPVQGFPVLGHEGSVILKMSPEDFGEASFELRTKAGTLLDSFDLEELENTAFKTFTGEVTLPDVPAMLYVSGVNFQGERFQRVLPQLLKAQTVRVDVPDLQDLHAGRPTTYVFRVTNLGPTDNFRFSAVDDARFVRTVNPARFTLGSHESREIIVTLLPPAGAEPGFIDTLTVSVESTTGSGAYNFAVLESRIVDDEADLAVVGTDSPDPVPSGSLLTWSIALANAGPADAEDAVVSIELPPGTAFVSCSADGICAGSAGRPTIAFRSLAAGTSADMKVQALVDCALKNGSVLDSSVSVSAATSDPEATNDTMAVTTTVSNPPPVIQGASVDKPVLWPPNHKMVDVAVSYAVGDNCGSPICALSVASNEPVAGLGDGDLALDWEVVDAHRVRLRAERAGTGNGRVYTVTITCSDTAGGSSQQVLTVKVPKSQGR